MKTEFGWGDILWISVLTLLFGMAIGVALGGSATKAEAIKAGVAEYQCNPATGKVTFVWKP